MAFGCGFALVLIVVLALTLRPKQSFALGKTDDFDPVALEARYRPMHRLLDGSDFETLRGMRDGKLMGNLRAQRRRIFRGYLRSLNRDHAKLCAQIRAQLVNASRDCPELASGLIKMELLFGFMMFSVNLRLLFHAAGLGNVTVHGLVGCFATVCRQAEMLATLPRIVNGPMALTLA